MLDTVIPPILFLNCFLPGLILQWLLQFIPACAGAVLLLELRRLHSWITSMEDVSRGEARFLTSVLLRIWHDNVRWLRVQDFAGGFLNLVLYLYPFSAVQLSNVICNY